jgi:hypothetical protein
MDLKELVKLSDERCGEGSLKEVGDYFKALAGDKRSLCSDEEGVLKQFGLELTGSDESLTMSYLVDTLTILSFKQGETVSISTGDRAKMLCGKHGLKPVDSSYDECLEGLQSKLNSDTKETSKSNSLTEEEEKLVLSTFGSNISIMLEELEFRYRDLFASGYDLNKPYGVLIKNKVLKLSGDKVIEESPVEIVKMYNCVEKAFGGSFETSDKRSIKGMIDKLYTNYSSGVNTLVYFPYKMLEFAYGRQKPTGDGQESKFTYSKHSDASSWAKYSAIEITADNANSMRGLLKTAVCKFVYHRLEGKEVNVDNIIPMMDDVINFLAYVQQSLSVCILMPKYEKSKDIVSAYKLRVCDPLNVLGNKNLSTDIIRDAFMGGLGVSPNSSEPLIEDRTFVKTYSHEFNYKKSQAKPLFSYKAYDICKENGITPTWDNMILGQFEDDSILTNGKRGVDLSRILIHHYIAGSRAGKGVMTLNMLASAITTGRAIFYLDNKPDMSSMFRSISKEMFTVNGASYGEKYDKYDGQLMFGDRQEAISINNIPDYLLNSQLKFEPTWDSLGTMFYMRALKLVVGIVIARGAEHTETNLQKLGGVDSGVLIVIDELTEFNGDFYKIFEKLVKTIPAASYEADKQKVEEGKLTQKRLDMDYTLEGFYTLAFLNSLIEDMETLKNYENKLFSTAEIGKSDIFIIGQSAKYNKVNSSDFAQELNGSRSKNAGSGGITKTGRRALLEDTVRSIPYTLANFRPADAFFGRNVERGYLKQDEKGSKAFSLLNNASYFAYINNYSESTKSAILDNSKDVDKISASAVYFKPYLVLNNNTSDYLDPMYERCTGLTAEQIASPQGFNHPSANITKEQVIAEYTAPDGVSIHPAVGFPGYLKHMGIEGWEDNLAKSGRIANTVVQDYLGYNGTWLEFITDLRPEWIFTISDIVSAAQGKPLKMRNPERWDATKDFYEFSPESFGGSREDDEEQSLFGEDFSDNEQNLNQTGYDSDSKKVYNNSEISQSSEIYSDPDEMHIFDDFDDFEDSETDVVIDNEVEFSDNPNDTHVFDDFSDFDEEVQMFEPDVEVIPKDEEIDFEKSFKTSMEDTRQGVENLSEIQSMLEKLEAMGYETTLKKKQQEKDFETYVKARPLDDFNVKTASILDDEYTSFNSDDLSHFERLVNKITEDVLKTFHGASRVKSFKVIGGTIVINKCAYQCKLGERMTSKLPYDLRREINSGNISKLFDYGRVFDMTSLRELQFDSLDLVYDCVSEAMGYGGRLSVDLFFKDLKSLEVLTLGNNTFRRSTYKKDIANDDVFYTPKASTKFFNASSNFLGDLRRKSWGLTKNTVTNKKYGLLTKGLAVAVGAVGTVGAGGAELFMKTGSAVTGNTTGFGRKATKGLGGIVKQFSDMFKE